MSDLSSKLKEIETRWREAKTYRPAETSAFPDDATSLLHQLADDADWLILAVKQLEKDLGAAVPRTIHWTELKKGQLVAVTYPTDGSLLAYSGQVDKANSHQMVLNRETGAGRVEYLVVDAYAAFPSVPAQVTLIRDSDEPPGAGWPPQCVPDIPEDYKKRLLGIDPNHGGTTP
ncbi:hypothetical protein [Nesterenkonia rhizosphaerae]|uniref:Uncharacterized protein n=1 Tax=Nesterenkonia rhizosphaerae TaxID=1348272 RepID=A0ABP9FWC0_9MICC